MKFTDAQDKAVKMLSSKEFIERVKEEDETMLEHLDTLKNINKNGYITVNSQAGRKEKGKSFQTGKPYEMIERAYTIGFMQESKAAAFIKNMSFTDKNAAFKMYPNPVSNGKLYIVSSTDLEKEVAIYNTLGQEVFQSKTNNQAINVSSLSKGTYFVKITEAGITATNKLIIQ